MSSLLEQAIIDAKLLKETARKNAEAALLEQYSEVVGAAVQSLLEQDEPVVPDMPGAAPAPAAAPSAPPAPDISSAVPADTSAATKKIVDRVPAAYLGEDNMQEIEINLDSLVEKVDALEAEVGPMISGIDMDRAYTQHGNPERVVPDGITENLEEGEDLEEGYELDEEALEEEISTAPAERDVATAQGNLGVAQRKLGDLKAQQTTEEETAARRQAVSGKKPTGPETSLAEELEEEGLELEEEMYLDMAGSDELGSHPGGINMNTINLKRQAGVDAALEAQNTELQEELGVKEEEVSALEEKLNAMLARLQETKGKLKKSTELNTELREGIKQLSTQFEKVSLLNARLLYTNKTLSNSSLNERQKQQIAESINSAKSVEQAKTIYETLQRSSGLLAERKSAPKSLTEAVNRVSSPFLPRSNTPSVDPAAERMRILAGIKK
jgi:hypothetical protein